MKADAGQRALARLASKRQTGASNHRFQGNAAQVPCGVRSLQPSPMQAAPSREEFV